MPSIDQRLTGGESESYRARPHWIALVGPLAVTVALGDPGALILVFSLAFWMDNFAVQSAFASGLLMVVGAGTIALGLLHRAAEIRVTDRRVFVTSGVLVKRKAQWSVLQIDSIEIRQGDLSRMLDYGSIVVHADRETAGPFRYISHPFDLRRKVQEEVAKAKNASQRAAA